LRLFLITLMERKCVFANLATGKILL